MPTNFTTTHFVGARQGRPSGTDQRRSSPFLYGHPVPPQAGWVVTPPAGSSLGPCLARHLARHIRLALGILLLGVFLAGCAIFTLDQRTAEGPSAEDVWKARFELMNARSPSFDETRNFEEETDARVEEFLRKHPEVANSYRVGNLRLFRQVSVGMTKEEITLLLGKPQDVTTDAARMEVLARHWWPLVKPNAKEAWVYPGGWTLYFDGNTLADMTRYRRALLHP